MTFRLFHVCLALFLATISARGQFTLELHPVSPGTGELRFTLEPGYYHRLENSGNLATGFSPASGWMLGNGNEVTWPIHYPTSSTSSGVGTAVAAGDTFSLYPFPNGKTLVTWTDLADARYSVLVADNYSALPPTVVVPENGTVPSAMLLVGHIAWDSAYEALASTQLPAAQQTVLARLPTPAAALAAATSGGTSGSGVVVDAEKQFFRIRRMEADADHDGLDWPWRRSYCTPTRTMPTATATAFPMKTRLPPAPIQPAATPIPMAPRHV